MTTCLCGSGRDLDLCCGPYLDGVRPAPTAEALMRSRYSAYALERWDYLAATQQGPFGGPPPATRWLRLAVRRVVGGGSADAEGVVEFEAFSKVGRVRRRLHEISRFERRAGRWIYVDGEILFAGALKR